jgi:hypothetical protein
MSGCSFARSVALLRATATHRPGSAPAAGSVFSRGRFSTCSCASSANERGNGRCAALAAFASTMSKRNSTTTRSQTAARRAGAS